jgi:hypothetical protein
VEVEAGAGVGAAGAVFPPAVEASEEEERAGTGSVR